ncbi:MAG: hypothetical protein V4717_16650 [Bacteroidota bacterium]
MKTILFAAALSLTTFSSAIANKTSKQKTFTVAATHSFEKEFGTVAEVNWSTTATNMLRASFKQDDESVSAFFDQSGNYVATTVNRTAESLPAKLRAAINKKEKDGIITEAVEFTSDDEQSYYVKVYVNGKEKLYKGSSIGQITQVNY